jgi:hypothetical protein
MQLIGRERVVASERFAEGVDRGRPDIAIDDADGAEGKLVQRPMGVAMRGILRSVRASGARRLQSQ